MTQAAKSQEPSMEEILASIRRIIADDDAKPSPAAPAVSPEPPPTPPAPPAPPPRQAAPPPPPVAPPPPAPPAPPRIDPAALIKEAAAKQDDIDRLLKEDAEAARAKPIVEPQAEEPQDVLDLTESMVTTRPASAAPRFQTIDGEPDVVFSEPEPTPPPAAAKAISEAPWPAQQSAAERSLLSSTTSAAVDSAFNTLAHTVLVQNSRTLEDLVREMLRPLLKGWLDDNLPSIVERLVKAEIERVSRGRG